MGRRRILIIVASILLVPIVLIAALVVVAQTEWAERSLEKMVSGKLDREVQIEDIGFRWGWPPGVVVAKFRIGNPSWAKTPNLIDADGLYARIHLLPLLKGMVVIPYLGANRAVSGLEVDGERATWRFGESSDEPSKLVLMRVYMDDGEVVYLDPKEKTQLKVLVKGSAGEGGELKATASGSFRGESLKASARIPELSTQHEAPVEFEGEAQVGRTRARANGWLATDGRSLDFDTQLSGATLKDLSKISGMVLPDSPPYTLRGHLKHEGNDWNFTRFAGKVGDSDLRGDLTYTKPLKGQPLLKASLQSKLLDFDDLGPLIGAPPKTGAGETASPEQKAKAAQRVASDRLLPDNEFGVAAWAKMDADVTLKADKIQRPKQLPIEAFSTHLVLKDSALTLNPLNFGVAGGNIVSTVNLNGKTQPVRGELKADLKSLQMGKLFPTVQTMQDALGTLYGRVELAGTGASVASLLGTSNGKASIVVEGGEVSALLMELLELDIAQIIMLFGKGGQKEQLRCAVSGFNVKNGVASADSFIIDSHETVVHVDGSVSFKDETLDLKATPNAKHSSLVSLRTPIKLQGPMRKPKVRPEAGPLVRKAAVAGALGAINPALAVFALYEPARGKDQPCGQLIAEAKAKGAGKAKTPDANPARAAEKKQEADSKVQVSSAPQSGGEEVAKRK